MPLVYLTAKSAALATLEVDASDEVDPDEDAADVEEEDEGPATDSSDDDTVFKIIDTNSPTFNNKIDDLGKNIKKRAQSSTQNRLGSPEYRIKIGHKVHKVLTCWMALVSSSSPWCSLMQPGTGVQANPQVIPKASEANTHGCVLLDS